MKIYEEAKDLLSVGKTISEVKSILNVKHKLKGASLALEMTATQKKIFNLEPRVDAVSKMTIAFIGTGEEVSGIRDIYYRRKHDIQVYQHPLQTEKEFSDAITAEIGLCLWRLFTTGQNDVYERLGLGTRRIELGSQALVLFVEKELPDYDYFKDEFGANVYIASGQSNLFEFASLASELRYHDDVYVITLTDYDPAGFAIAETVATNLQLACNAFYGTEVHHTHVSFTDVLDYPTYELSSVEANKKSWDGSPFGVELNAIPLFDRRVAIIDAMEDVDLEIFRDLAIQRRKQIEFEKALEESEPYQQLLLDKEEMLDEIRAEINGAEYDFDTDRFDSILTSKVVVMAERV